MNNTLVIKTKGLTEKDVLEICKEIGCERNLVKSSQNWCYFPAHPALCESIHYEYLNGKVQFHIECEAIGLRNLIENNILLKLKSPNAPNGWELVNKPSEGNVAKQFESLKNAVEPCINDYLSYIKSKYGKEAHAYKEEKSKVRVLYNHLNFFELLSNSQEDGSCGEISENENTRILLAILKTGSDELTVLDSFLKEFGINVDISNPKTSKPGIKFNKRYDDKEGSNFIDGLIYKRGEYAIIIENKLCGAGDQPKQIERYIKALKEQERVELDKIWVVYLTKDGTLHSGRPTEESYRNNRQNALFIDNRLICINYHDDILPWLKEEVLPMIKYTESSMAWGTDCYIDYLERMFQEDAASRKMISKMKKTIFDSLGINDNDSIVERYSRLNEPVKELSCTTIYKDYVGILQNYIREIEKPISDAFERATIDYYKEKGKDVVVRNKLNSGYIQIYGKGWNPLVHYEWYPVSLDTFFFGTKPINLCIHIEGKELKNKKGELKDKLPITCEIEEKSIAQMTFEELKDWLGKQYEKVIINWDDLQNIAQLKDIS